MNTFKTSTSRKGTSPNETMYKVSFAHSHFTTHVEFDREGPCYNYSRIYKKGGWDDYHEETCTRAKVLHYIKLLKKRSEAPNATWLGRTDVFSNKDGSLKSCYYTYETYSEQRVPENSFDGTSEPAEGDEYVLFIEPIRTPQPKPAEVFPTTKKDFYEYWNKKYSEPKWCLKTSTGDLWLWDATTAKLNDHLSYFCSGCDWNEAYNMSGVKRQFKTVVVRNKWGYPELHFSDNDTTLIISCIIKK